MNKKELINILRIEALDLGPEQTKVIECPKCERERSLKRNMTLTRTYDGIVYHCFSASCGIAGFISSSKQLYTSKKKKTFKPRILTRPLKGLPKSLIQKLLNEYGILKEVIETHGLMYDYLAHRLAIPIYDLQGRRVGWTCKALEKENVPKTIEYWENETFKLNVGLNKFRTSKTFLVEDSLSMLRLNAYFNSIALLGVGLTYEAANEIAHQFRNIVIALDADTWENIKVPVSIQLRNKYYLMFDSFEVLRISKDPKDMTPEEFGLEILSNV